ncbi:hypothetical protein [Flavobacterium sp.]|uniref:hypothetical protein n=1 Tax=Flavobacterium sp. TaxID=239 RepID=UPI002B4AE040|nr:hypothetical protein [Flavobacterium sp.]HLP64742.1 hypothetical protein [Flavobacterium sp.]
MQNNKTTIKELSTGDKLALLGLILAVIAIVTPLSIDYLSKKRQDELFEQSKKVTVNRLNKYKEILHSEKRPLFDAKKKLINNLLCDSIEYMDENLILMLNNNSNRIDSWKSKHLSQDYYFSVKEFKDENINLLKENKELYIKVCKKNKLPIDTTFFRRFSFY